ncbi:MAG: fatty acid desaturase [Deltaproteobacteria bacterium]|nr:fatty acid desaturase [Deltaproteobacteria bacterium]
MKGGLKGNETLPGIVRSIPQELFRKDLTKSLYFVFESFAMAVGLFSLIMLFPSWLFGIPLGLLLGVCLGGLFVVGHDCGHRSFSRSIRLNNLVGYLTTSLVCWPFHLWRKDHDQHHRYTAHLDRDTAWRPVTFALWRRLPWLSRMIYLWTRIFFFLGSFYTTFVQIRHGLRLLFSGTCEAEEKKDVFISLLMMVLLVSVYISLACLSGGFYGFICGFLIPQIVFQCLLSTFTFFHHTHPDVLFMSRKEWRPEVAQLTRTVHLRYPAWLEYCVRDINWHVPHHVCVAIPHYHLRKAHKALRKAYPDCIREERLTWKYIRNVVSCCHFVESRSASAPAWISYRDALAREKKRVTEKVSPSKIAV